MSCVALVPVPGHILFWKEHLSSSEVLEAKGLYGIVSLANDYSADE